MNLPLVDRIVRIFGCLLLIPLLGAWCPGQEEKPNSSRRKNVETQSVEFPMVGDKNRSLLSKMTDDRRTPNANGLRTNRAAEHSNNQFIKSSSATGPSATAPLADSSDKSQYPIFESRSLVDPKQYQIKEQRSVRVASRVSSQPERRRGFKNQERSNSARVTSNNRSRNSQSMRGANRLVATNKNEPESLELMEAGHQDSTGPLLSVLESSTVSSDADAVSIDWLPPDRIGENSIMRTEPVAIPTQSDEPSMRRPKEILLGPAASESSLRRSAPTATSENVFELRHSEDAEAAKRSERTAKLDAVVENLTDQPKTVARNQELQQRLRFAKPSQKSQTTTWNISDANQSKKENEVLGIGHNDGIIQPIKKQSELTKDELDQIENMEFEEFESSVEDNSQLKPARPSEMWLNRKKRSRSSRNNREEFEQGVDSNGSVDELGTIKAIQMSFGDQEKQAELGSPFDDTATQSLEPVIEDDVDPLDVDDLFVEEESKEGQQEIEARQQREQLRVGYRGDLYERLSEKPVQLVMSYVDDMGAQVPASTLKQQYLVDFGGYYVNETRGNQCRVDSHGMNWGIHCAVWSSPNLCYKALYFEDVNLERSGARYPVLQPALSAVHFFGSTVRLPYRMALDPLHECQYSAGFSRPGNRSCYQRERFVFSPKAATFQALLITAAAFALP